MTQKNRRNAPFIDSRCQRPEYEPVLIAPFFASPVLLLGLIWLMVTTSSRRRLRRSREKALSEVMKGTGTVISGSRDKGRSDKRR